MFLSLNERNVVVAVSDEPISVDGCITKEVTGTCEQARARLGQRMNVTKQSSDIRLAVICNWNSPCGISTYTSFLVKALAPMVKEVRIFSEEGDPLTTDDENVVRCWKRGKPLIHAMKLVREWKPDFVIVQHEYGIFPNACYYLQMLQALDDIPYVVAMHSVYEHLDKTICTSATKGMIVHSEQAKQALLRSGNKNKIWVVPHGCITHTDTEELFNIFKTPYAIFQFGFGFFYKGVDRALEAVHHLKSTDPKFKDIFYCYLCAESPFNTSIHDEYCAYLMDRADQLGIRENVAIVRGFQTESVIRNYLRTAKLAIFPYVNNPDNQVYGASGAIRIAMSQSTIPAIASESHLFDDLEGVIPRPGNHLELAREVDEVFSNDAYRKSIMDRIAEHVKKNSWEVAASNYLECYQTYDD